ncbi:MAG TPA: phosphatase PAP2-related protein [Tepidisphaeraceae bacterium]|nr:phosphatase PAP2-related protein [Tepidisphaeraceae bacterium]
MMNLLAITLTPWPVIGVRFALVVAGIGLWYLTQALLAKRVPKVAYEIPLTDGIHVLTARIHKRYFTNIAAGNRLLIASSLVIDLLGAYLIGSAIFGVSIRPYLGLVMVFALRQVCQMLCPLPAPHEMVWRYPGVPAVLVTYGTANDLFFSGHTAIAVYGAATLAGHWGHAGLVLGIAIALFEAVTVLVLRAHYTMDVFTGIICALWVYSLSGPLALWVDGAIGQWVG